MLILNNDRKGWLCVRSFISLLILALVISYMRALPNWVSPVLAASITNRLITICCLDDVSPSVEDMKTQTFIMAQPATVHYITIWTFRFQTWINWN